MDGWREIGAGAGGIKGPILPCAKPPGTTHAAGGLMAAVIL